LHCEGYTAVGSTSVESTICSLKLWLARVKERVFCDRCEGTYTRLGPKSQLEDLSASLEERTARGCG
jgi:hypothetical protein